VLHSKKIHGLCRSPSITVTVTCSKPQWAGHAARMGETRNSYRILVGKWPFERPSRRCGG